MYVPASLNKCVYKRLKKNCKKSLGSLNKLARIIALDDGSTDNKLTLIN